MADMFQGSALPNITTTKTDVTSGPSWYNSYLADLAQTGSQALGRSPEQAVAGFTPLQSASIEATPGAAAAYQPFLQGATSALGKTSGLSAVSAASPYVSTAAQNAPTTVGQYMDPYQQQVVDEIGRLGYQNIRENLRPQATARSVATGDYGSKRGEEIMGQTLRGALSDITGAQSKALSSGYQSALTAAQADKARQLQAGQLMGTLTGTDYSNALQEAQTSGALGTTAQTLGLKGTEATFSAGEQEQKLRQALLNAPLTQATNAANIFTNLKVPTTVSQTANAPIPGAYANSPLSQIAGLGTLFASGSGGSSSAVNNVLKTVLGEKTFADVASKGILGAITGSKDIVPDVPNRDLTSDETSRLYGKTQNEDGTYTDNYSGEIFDRNGILIWSPNDLNDVDTTTPPIDDYDSQIEDEIARSWEEYYAMIAEEERRRRLLENEE